jgi:hypothetical protein
MSCWEPWASLIAGGAKRIETRNWSTQHRGELAIHAAGTLHPAGRMLLEEPACQLALKEAGLEPPAGWTQLPLGVVVCTVELTRMVQIPAFTNRWDARRWVGELRASGSDGVGINEEDARDELLFGDYRPGRWAWLLENVQRLYDPVAAIGHQRLWAWTPPPT